MELELSKVDFGVVGITLQNALKLLPLNEKRQQQNIVIGDQDGVLQILAIKKGDPKIQFKSLPGEKIASVQLGGAPGTQADKIFVASENNVRGFSKKGKVFLSFDTNLTEAIKCMFVSGSDLLICGNHVYNHYKDCKETGTYLCGDAIVDLAALCPNNTSRVITALACSGRVLRLLEHCRVRQSIELESIPTVLHVPKKQMGDKLICGFTDGSVILFTINPYLTDIKNNIIVDKTINSSAITCIDSCDINGDGKCDLLIGRRDGTVQVFTINLDDNTGLEECVQIYRNNFDESISSIQGGHVSSCDYPEIIIATYTGRIFSLTTQCINSSISNENLASSTRMVNEATSSVSSQTSVDNQRIIRLRSDIEELEQIIAKERDKYQQSTQNLSNDVSVVPIIPINDSLTLNKSDATYTLSIELTSPIEYLFLQCDIALELVDVVENTAMISFSQCDLINGNALLATYQCQKNANNTNIIFRTIEGYNGTLNVYVMPNFETKCAELKSYAIKPLSLHMRTHYNENDSRPFSELQLRGTFSQAEIYNWIKCCIPEVPEKIEAEEITIYCFKNVLINTILICEFRKGEVKFRSDNLSTISILKDFMTKEATKRRIKIEISTSLNESSIFHMLNILQPELDMIIKLKVDHQLLKALLELDIRDADEFQVLSSKYKQLLNNKNYIINDFKSYSSQMKKIYGLITDLYVDKFKFKGVNVKKKIPELINILDNYSFAELQTFFS